ncbi:MAG: glutathione-disulfide reductase [Kaiparowitsia implicata GSE-PSE-MK54-09C]|jgi:glutathione reductase (NADPH)|nr:glutathione-disulfide reductase [Kaiparowitsia implicata GSE-PSE-MK54-09C]
MNYTYDFVVIGGGSGGLAAATRAAHYGVSVALIEQEHLGGTCVNRGCVPKKLMVYAADAPCQIELAQDYGWQIPLSAFDWEHFKHLRELEIERLRQVYDMSLSNAGVRRLMGRARLLDSHTIQVKGDRITADKILIAVGGKPIVPDIPGIEHAVTSRELFDLPEIPQHIAIIGGGYIGVEFASIMRGLGCEVSILNRKSGILTGFDSDITQLLRDRLQKRGILSLCNTKATAIERKDSVLELSLSGDRSEPLRADVVLCAAGRSPNLDGLGLDQASVEYSKTAIEVDDYSCTSQPNIYAIGDCTGRLPLTPVAIAEGRAAADTIFGNKARKLDYGSIPTAVFSRPEVAAVGMTEAEAREHFGDDDVTCDRTEFRPLMYSFTNGSLKTTIKYVSRQKTDQVVGLHILGEHAAEMIQGMALAIKQGITRVEIADAIGIHPTSGEELFSFNIE